MANSTRLPPIYVISGNLGVLGEQLVRTGLAQFQGAQPSIKIIPRVQHLSQLETILTDAASVGATVVHTMVNAEMRHALVELARAKNVIAIDVLGPFLEHIARQINQEPVGKPGLYRQLHETYFKRIDAIEFTTTLDDGMNYQKWQQAEIVLVGVSRVGKTPISLYLSMLGWKVANVPLVAEITPPDELFQLDRRRVVGLTIDPTQLLHHRNHRQSQLGVTGASDYNRPEKIYAELEFARQIFRRGRFKVIDISDKPIETCADEIIGLVLRQLKSE